MHQQQIISCFNDCGSLQIVANASKVKPKKDNTILNISNHQGIVEYRPEELVITVKSGTTLQEINHILYQNQQMLAFEPVDFGNSTIGGTVAMAISGQRSAYLGGIRDFVLGMEIINGKGEYCRFGGKVMKNVAGFDFARLLTGSQGKLAVIMQMSLKVLPLVKDEKSFQIKAQTNEVLDILAHLDQLNLSGVIYQDNILSYRLKGKNTLTANEITNDFWQTLNLPYFSNDAFAQMGDKFSEITGDTLILDLGGYRRWCKEYIPNKKSNVEALTDKIKLAFDPNSIFV